MTNTETRPENRCPFCELGMSEAMTVVSRHHVSTGTVVYARCECGRLSMWVVPAARPPRPPQLRAKAGTVAY